MAAWWPESGTGTPLLIGIERHSHDSYFGIYDIPDAHMGTFAKRADTHEGQIQSTVLATMCHRSVCPDEETYGRRIVAALAIHMEMDGIEGHRYPAGASVGAAGVGMDSTEPDDELH